MADKEVFVTIITRGGTTEEWESANPTPKDREFCVEATTDGKRKFKIGDGVTAWNDLPYATTDELADLTQDATHRTVTDAEKAEWSGKQDALTFDDAPAAGSNNPVKSSGIKTALDAKATAADLAAIAKSGNLADATEDASHRTVTDEEKATWNAAAGIEGQIPTKTSDLTNDGENGTDKFATESYVNQKTSQIYRYKGSVATYAKLPSTHDVGDVYNVIAAYGEYPAGTNFAWNGTEWDSLGGSIDTSAFVEESELAPIAKSGKLSDATEDATHRVVTDTEKAAWNAKQSALTFDDAPTAGSANPVKSGGVKTALDAKANGADLAAIAKSGKLSDATEDATHRVVTATEKAAWNAKQDALTFDTTPTASSSNPVTSGGVKTALDAKAAKSEIVKTSTGLTDSADLMRYTDTLTINGGGVS